MTKLKALKVSCSDWMHTWGMGTNHVGTLELDTLNNQFIWKGQCCGRHGQEWNKRSKIIFTVAEGDETDTNAERITIIEAKGTLPIYLEVFKSVNLLLKMQLER